MGEIVGAGLVSHVPTIMLPEEVRLEINEGKEISLVTGLRRLRTEVLDRLRAEGVLAGAIAPGVLRLVTHLDVDDHDIERACKALSTV